MHRFGTNLIARSDGDHRDRSGGRMRRFRRRAGTFTLAGTAEQLRDDADLLQESYLRFLADSERKTA